MEISKKQFVLYTIVLLIIAGSVTLALGERPEDAGALWDQIWQVAQPVSIDDNEGSITVDGTVIVTDGDGPVTVDGTVAVTQPIVVEGSESSDPVSVIVQGEPVGVALDEPITIEGAEDGAPIAVYVVRGETPVDVIGAYDVISVWDYEPVDVITDLETVDTRGYRKVNIFYKEHMGNTYDPDYRLYIAWNIAPGVGGPEEIIEDEGLYSYDVQGPYLKLYVFEEDLDPTLKHISVWIYLTY